MPRQSSTFRTLARATGVLVLGGLALLSLSRLWVSTGQPFPADIRVWGRQGVDAGHFVKPRAIATGAGEFYVVDMTSRIQVFSEDGGFRRQWRTPEARLGKPCGLGWSNDGLLMVADTHYFRVLFYRPEGTLVPERTIGGTNGHGPGEFGFLTDVVQDRDGNYYVSEYGDFDRIQKFDAAGQFVTQIGSRGDQPGQFLRPQCLLIDEQNRLWVADACNHRIQIFSLEGEEPQLVGYWGTSGQNAGELRYPYGMVFDTPKTVVICEFGNHRMHRFSREGIPLSVWGGPGKEPGQFHQPWSLCLDSQSRLVVLDSYNHRVQQFALPRDEPVPMGSPEEMANSEPLAGPSQ
jgi:sugar lactone lactonase YvrE